MQQRTIVLGVAAALAAPASAAVTYSNTATRVGTVHPLLPAGQADGPEHGNQVTLSGTQRTVTKVEVLLRAGESGVAQFDAALRLYANDGAQGAPGTLLFSGEPRRFIIDSGADLMYPFPVSSVTVPDTFTWTLQITGRTGGNQAALGPAHYNPPTAGSAASGYWVHSGGAWTLAGVGSPPFGARVTAIGTCSPDFDHDGDSGTDFDIQAFFACLGGNCCATCDTADFDGDGDVGTDFDIQAFFRVLGGGSC